MKLQRLFALSITAVIAAACSSGGSTIAPHPGPSTAGSTPSSTKHAANAKLTLKFPADFVRLKKSASATARRRGPAFIDPGEGYTDLIAVQVTNYPTSGAEPYSYMATTANSVSSGINSQTIPLYLAPGYDVVTIQEYEPAPGGYLLSSQSGYLLAQGQTPQTYISETGTNNLSATMQLVMGSYLTNSSPNHNYDPAGGVAVVVDSSYDTASPEFLSTSQNAGTNSPMCVSPDEGSTVYFVPVDEQFGAGLNAYLSGNSGDSAEDNAGVPIPVVSAVSENGGTSALVSSPLGYYTPQFDGNSDPIDVTVTFPSGALVDPTPFGPFSGLTPGGSVVTSVATPGNPTYYATLESLDDCSNVPPEAEARNPHEAVIRKAPPKR